MKPVMATPRVLPSSDILRTRQSTSNNPDDDGGGVYLQDLWFIVLGVVVAICILFLWLKSRRKRANSARRTQNGRNALSQDVERIGLAVRPHHRLGRRIGRQTTQMEEGLDETGEAPPAYNEVGDDKPPSITIRSSSHDGTVTSHRRSDASQPDSTTFDSQSFSASHQNHPPQYGQFQSTTDAAHEPAADILIRPRQAVLATPRDTSEVNN